jgi:hypothetical protein
MIVANLGFAIDHQCAIELDDIRVVIAELVSSSVAADHYILGHNASRRPEADIKFEFNWGRGREV